MTYDEALAAWHAAKEAQATASRAVHAFIDENEEWYWRGPENPNLSSQLSRLIRVEARMEEATEVALQALVGLEPTHWYQRKF